MNRVKFLGVAIDVHGQPTGTIWRMSNNRHMTTLVIPNERLYQLLAEAEQPARRQPQSAAQGKESSQ